MGVIPIVFSPPPANGIDLGRCLSRAEWAGLNLDECNFNIKQMLQTRKDVYHFLDKIKKNYRVIRLDEMICSNSQCKTHFGSTWIFRDKGYLLYDGATALGEKYGFYSMIGGKE